MNPDPTPERAEPPGLTGRHWWLATGLVLALALAATVPTAGDIGLTWDEPAYRYSQLFSAQWWQRLAKVRTQIDLAALVEPDTLLYYWPYGRFGRNFHPPLAGQLNLATYALFGGWVKDIPARRLASVFEYALTITLGFGFLARRYGPWVGGVMAGALLAMPRVYGDGHIAGTDAPGLLLWAATALAFWKGLYEPRARRWRVLVGVLLGLAFVEKMAAIMVLAPLLAWMVAARLPRTLTRAGQADWIDGVVTTSLMLAPLGVAFLEILRIARQLPAPDRTELFGNPYSSPFPGAILAVPLAVWVVRRLLGRVFRAHAVWGAERPALEIWTAVLAFAPVVGWLGNPAWWRATLPRLAHYYAINSGRRGALPDIRIQYWGAIYEYSLPWHNAWVLIAITVPATLLAAALVGLIYGLRNLRRDQVPLYFFVHLITLPLIRMLNTPAHDGVRLFLPTFFFLAAFAGWGAVWLADGLARLFRTRPAWFRTAVAAVVLVPAARQLVNIHPFELSYYNELIGGPVGAYKHGFELTYWYDAFNDKTLAALNDPKVLPPGASVDLLNERTNPDTFLDLQSLGHLRADLNLIGGDVKDYPYVWLLSQDSKASTFTRLLFLMKPKYERHPEQLGRLRVVTLADPAAVGRAWVLQNLVEAPGKGKLDPPAGEAPAWVRRYAPWLGRFWGEGVIRTPPPVLNEPLFAWARRDPAGLRDAARALAGNKELLDWAKADPFAATIAAHDLALGRTREDDPNPARLRSLFKDQDDALRLLLMMARHAIHQKAAPNPPDSLFTMKFFTPRPEAVPEAIDILIAHPDAVRRAATHLLFTDPDTVGGWLDDK